MTAKWRGLALLGVTGVHVLVGFSLYAYRPDAIAPRLFQREDVEPELLMLLEFPAPRKTLRDNADSAGARVVRRKLPRSLASTAAETGMRMTSAPRAPATAALDLHLPPPVETRFSRPALLDARRTISYQATRYERAWISEGNLTHVVARKSQLAGVLLSVMGALIEACTEADRANYKRGCVQDQYVHEPEELYLEDEAKLPR